MYTCNTLLAYVTAAVWLAMGCAIGASAWLDSIGVAINVIVGVCFALVGGFLAQRAASVAALMAMLRTADDATRAVSRRFVRNECWLNGLALVVSLVLLSGVLHRVLGEGKAVFG